MKKILVVDDSALMRRVLSDIINADKRFQVAGNAVNGQEALDYLKKNNDFDAILLDLNMPVLDGVGFMKEYQKLGYEIPVFIVSAIASQSGRETIEALELGAIDFLTKPTSLADLRSDPFTNKIVSILEIMLHIDKGSDSALENEKEEEQVSVKPVEKPVKIHKEVVDVVGKGKTKSGKLVALACSTGGPRALKAVIPLLPKNLDAPIVMVQHMPEGFTASLAKRLDELSEITVKEAQEGDILQAGVAYLAKGGSQLRIVPDKASKRHKIFLTKEPPRGGLRPCADIMYESLCKCNYNEITCVVLTGMGSDGTSGVRQLREVHPVYTIAQDEATSTVYGMPKAIADEGLTNEILPLQDVAEAITKKVGVR